MKNILFILGFTAVLLACTKEAESVGSSAEDSPITLNLSISSASPDTKSIKKDWDHGDVMAHLQSSVFKLSKDLIDSIHEEGIVAYTS